MSLTCQIPTKEIREKEKEAKVVVNVAAFHLVLESRVWQRAGRCCFFLPPALFFVLFLTYGNCHCKSLSLSLPDGDLLSLFVNYFPLKFYDQYSFFLSLHSITSIAYWFLLFLLITNFCRESLIKIKYFKVPNTLNYHSWCSYFEVCLTVVSVLS